MRYQICEQWMLVLSNANFCHFDNGGGSSIFPCELSTHFILVFFMQRLLEESRKEIMAQKIIAADGSV